MLAFGLLGAIGILCFVSLRGIETKAAQIPISLPHVHNSESNDQVHSGLGDSWANWDLDVLPNQNATGHLVFATVSSFLQHWPNTRYRNGHNIVPGIVPPGSLLYHGRGDNTLPTTPEWTSTDPEHSYIFCRGNENGSCWHLTLVTTRPLKVLYFDGSSAAKMIDGPMDTQDIISWGKIIPERYFAERERAQAMCDWGKKFGVDGYVRMEMDFEIILCDFTAGVEIESFLNLRGRPGRPGGGPGRRPERPPGGPGGPGGPRGPGGPGGQFPPEHPPMHDGKYGKKDSPFKSPHNLADNTEGFEVIHSGAWHDRFPGDTRIKLDLANIISFYDTKLVPSLVAARSGQNRLEHRLLNATDAELKRVIENLEDILRNPPIGSGVDWTTLFKVVIDRYDDRLEIVDYLLNSTNTTTTDSESFKIAQKVQAQLKTMLRPYILYSASPSNSSDTSPWASPIYKLCSTTHTRYLTSSSLSQSFTHSEKLLLNAAQETSREICRTITKMWVGGVMYGLDETLSPEPKSDEDEPSDEDLKKLLVSWKTEVERLMLWLDWSVWLKCRPACGFEEMCYLPTWPFGWGREQNEMRDPQPKCIRRIEPYTLGV